MKKKKRLTVELLKKAATKFCLLESKFKNKELYGVTDGKKIGTYVEHKFERLLEDNYIFIKGSSAKGIDLPGNKIQTDIKVTSIKQPQSSCPFDNAKQKIFGLGYNLLLFVYDKMDNPKNNTAVLNFLSCSFLKKERTADYTLSFRLREMLKDGAKKEDIIAYLNDRNIPADEITLNQIAEQILNKTPQQGFLTISNALQWRLQYNRIVTLTGSVSGITKLVDKINK